MPVGAGVVLPSHDSTAEAGELAVKVCVVLVYQRCLRGGHVSRSPVHCNLEVYQRLTRTGGSVEEDHPVSLQLLQHLGYG